MYKIAIIGSENSHARRFAKILHQGHPLLGGVPYSDFQIVGICGDNPDENKYLQETYNIPEISDDPEHWVGKVDGVMVTARHGAKHFPYAKKYIEAGTPAFIDKPITIDPEEAIALITLASKLGVPLVGGSAYALVDDTRYMKRVAANVGRIYGGAVSAPIDMKNPHGDFFFYSHHLVQIMLSIFGYDIKSVIANGREDSATFLAKYADFDVSGHYGPRCSATVYGEKDVYHRNIDFETDEYISEFHQFEHIVRTGKMLGSYENLIKPVFVLNALYESMQTGKEVAVRDFKLGE